jgi:hypothetical protein
MIKQILLALLLTVLVSSFSAGQVNPAKGRVFLRTTIESYPEDERRPILDYLDGARSAADKVALNFAAERDAELDIDFSRVARDRGAKIFVREYANMVRRVYGSVTSFEFRGQALEASPENPDVHDLARAKSAVYYAIRTTKRPEGELFLIIRTLRIRNMHSAASFDVNDYKNNVPPWLQGE